MTWLAQRVRSFRYAFHGLAHVARTQGNFQVHLLAAAAVVIAAVALQVPPPELAVLGLTIGLVLTAEAVNTAVEAAVDAIGGPPSDHGRHAKDAAAASVLLAAGAAIVVAALIFGPRLR